MMLYIATDIHGKGVRYISAFENRYDFMCYATRYAWGDRRVYKSDTIATICDKLYDKAVGYGSRDHYRVNRQEARALIRNGVISFDCWNLPEAA